MDQEHDDISVVKKKRKYSRKGCLECKRKKAKCDEGKPACWNCSRLGKECIYPSLIGTKAMKPPPQDTLTESISAATDLGLSLSDANFLFNDLNDIVNMRLEEVMTPYLRTHIQATLNPFDTSIDLPTDLTDNNGSIINQFNLTEPHNRYLQMFYDSFSTLMSPLKPNPLLNPVRDILLAYALKETYLLYCVLACGAKSAHRESLELEHNEAYYSYLSTCLSRLNEDFSNLESVQHEKFESMLLTLLLLTGDCASSKYLKWRTHLDGAKKLLKKSKSKSDAISFCRNWFILYEILAGITNEKGGTFNSVDDSDLDDFINNDNSYIESLKRLNMIDDKGFCFISGHIIDLDIVYKDIIKILNKIRELKSNGQLERVNSHLDCFVEGPPIVNLDLINKLLRRLDDLQDRVIIDKAPLISQNHPLFNYKPNNPDKSASIDTRTLSSGEIITISLFDMTHQTHTLGAKIVVLSNILQMPKTSILVQEIVQKALSYIRFLEQLEDFDNICITHLHFPMSQIGKHCVYPRDQKLIEKFMKIIHNMGLYSAMHNLQRLQKIWSGEDDGAEEDFLTW